MKITKRSVSFVAVAAASALALAGCAPAATEEPGDDLGDRKVEIFGGYGEAQTAAFQEELDAWSAESGIEVTFTSLASFDTDIKVKIEAGQEPDIALWPQPGDRGVQGRRRHLFRTPAGQ